MSAGCSDGTLTPLLPAVVGRPRPEAHGGPAAGAGTYHMDGSLNEEDRRADQRGHRRGQLAAGVLGQRPHLRRGDGGGPARASPRPAAGRRRGRPARGAVGRVAAGRGAADHRPQPGLAGLDVGVPGGLPARRLAVHDHPAPPGRRRRQAAARHHGHQPAPVLLGLLALLAATATYYALLFTLAQFFQQGLGRSALASGLILLPWVAAFGIA